jgi:hypothetical protein
MAGKTRLSIKRIKHQVYLDEDLTGMLIKIKNVEAPGSTLTKYIAKILSKYVNENKDKIVGYNVDYSEFE